MINKKQNKPFSIWNEKPGCRFQILLIWIRAYEISIIPIRFFTSFLFYSCSDSNEQIDHSGPTDIPQRKIIIETNGTTRVLIQQLDPSADLFVMQMKAGDRNETIGRGTCKIFCSAREFVGIEVEEKRFFSKGQVRVLRNLGFFQTKKKGRTIRLLF